MIVRQGRDLLFYQNTFIENSEICRLFWKDMKAKIETQLLIEGSAQLSAIQVTLKTAFDPADTMLQISHPYLVIVSSTKK